MPRKGTLAVGLAAFLASATACWGADIHGKSSTQLSFYDDYFTGRQVELTEYLRLSVTDVDKEKKVSFYGYGRGSQDLTGGDGLHGRLYYLYGEYRDLFNVMDVRAGRQYVNLSAGSAIIDGGQVEFRGIPNVTVTVLGGRDVVFGEQTEISSLGYDFGVSAALAGFKKTDIDLSYLLKHRDGDARETLGASFKQYLLDSVKVYGDFKYDIPSELFSQVTVGAKYYPSTDLIFTAEYYESYPIFDSSSIYSVFAVNQYQEMVLRADYTFNDKVSVNGGYNRQWYGDGGAADVYHIGTGIRPLEHLKINAEYDKRSGYYGAADGVSLDAAYELMKNAEVAAGFYYDVYTRDALTGDDIARSYWVGGKYKLGKSMALSARVQNDVNVRYTQNVSGRFVFDYNF
jgi:hypothetical protein